MHTRHRDLRRGLDGGRHVRARWGTVVSHLHVPHPGVVRVPVRLHLDGVSSAGGCERGGRRLCPSQSRCGLLRLLVFLVLFVLPVGIFVIFEPDSCVVGVVNPFALFEVLRAFVPLLLLVVFPRSFLGGFGRLLELRQGCVCSYLLEAYLDRAQTRGR